MSKNLTLGAIKKDNAKYKKTKRIQLDSTTHLDVDTKFDPSKRALAKVDFVNIVFTKLLELTKEASDGDMLDEEKYDASTNNYLNEKALLALEILLIIKHFTSLEVKANDYDECFNAIEQLESYEYLQTILESFGKDEFNLLLNEFSSEIDTVNAKIDQLIKEQKQ
ncbi:hypothetical protein [Paenibacillus odorifer]|uniref:hypothetical protein n=1 Tax=Paenibacillus odorifer TaxID=189426 RepID=UPI00096D9436|nr:hypothetical protein [Paenibacillus odorifer]OMD75289.1 hypothetical protein BSK50_19000 [Paenibacillus odorifer]